MVSPWYCDTHVLVVPYAALWSLERSPALGNVVPRCNLVRSSSAVLYCGMRRVPSCLAQVAIDAQLCWLAMCLRRCCRRVYLRTC
eukprot:3471634-Rhodomonas_salina.3